MAYRALRFVGLDRPDDEGFDDFWDILKIANPSEGLQAVRSSGAATFANHPVRYWMSGVNDETFVTNMYANMPFDVAAGGLLDGVNVNEGRERPEALVAAARPRLPGGRDRRGRLQPRPPLGGGLPGLSRLYIHAPRGLDERAIVAAIRARRTTVSTGPMLVAAIDDDQPPGAVVAAGRTHRISARGWARSDRTDRLKRVELWVHDRVQQARDLDSTEAEVSFNWARRPSTTGSPSGSSRRAVGADLRLPRHRPGVGIPHAGRRQGRRPGPRAVGRATRSAKVEVWDNRPDAPGAKAVRTAPLDANGRAGVRRR